MEVIKVGVRQQHEIDRWQVLNLQAGTLDALEQEQPVREVRIHQNVQVRELDQKGSMPDPRDGNLTGFEFWKDGALVFAMAAREQGLPDEFAEEGARVEMLRRREIFERFRQSLAGRNRTMCRGFRHIERRELSANRGLNKT